MHPNRIVYVEDGETVWGPNGQGYECSGGYGPCDPITTHWRPVGGAPKLTNNPHDWPQWFLPGTRVLFMQGFERLKKDAD